MHHCLYAILFGVSEETQLCYSRNVITICISPRLNHPDKEYLLLYLTSITLLSSITVFRDSIHIGSISPSSTIHLGPSCEMLASSLMIDENSPGRVT